MKLHFNCDPLTPSVRAEPLVFTWDPDAGTVDGPDAGLVRWMATWGTVQAHPLPWVWAMSAQPLKNWTDMAAIVGSEWRLPPELREHYPRYEAPEAPSDDSGNPLPGVFS
jgi:hypothetical protein